MAESGYIFGNVLKCLTPRDRVTLYEEVKDSLPERLIRTCLQLCSGKEGQGYEEQMLNRHLKRAIEYLPQDCAYELYQAVKAQLPEEFTLESLIEPPQVQDETLSFKASLGNLKDSSDTEDDHAQDAPSSPGSGKSST
jgi:hypothetical protein